MPKLHLKPRAAAAPAAAITTANIPLNAIKLIPKRRVLEMVPLSYPTILRHIRDGRFPSGKDLGGKVAWYEHEIRAWLDKLPDQAPEVKEVT